MERNKSTRTGVSVCVLSLTLSLASPARTLYVDDDGPADFSTIQAAIDAAAEGDTILVRPGTYTGDGNRDIEFRGKAITVRSLDPNDPKIVESTVVDCNGTDVDSHRGFLFASGEDPNSILDGIAIVNGWSQGGGAVLCIASRPTISRCVIRGNSAVPVPGRRLPSYDLPDFAGWNGGGINACRNARPAILDCLLEDNHGVSGGGIYVCESDDVVIVGCQVRNNRATEAGGGIYCGGFGFQAGGSIRDCIVAANVAAKGAGIFCGSNQPVIAHCVIKHNLATTEPTGLGIRYGGGGVTCYQSNPTFLNCTIVGNHANASGGGINCPSGWGKVVLRNCIVWGNSAQHGTQLARTCCGCVVGCQQIELDHCCIQMNSNALFAEHMHVLEIGNTWTIDLQAQHSMDADPCFASPGHWDLGGTPYDPHDDAWISGDYHLKSQAGRWDVASESWVIDDVTSPCIDAGDPNSPVRDEPEPNGGRINMGAYGGTPEASKSYFPP